MERSDVVDFDSLAEYMKYIAEQKGVPLVGIAWDLKHRPTSNTHCAPEGRPTNFFGNMSIARHYDGLNGRIWLRFANVPGYVAANAGSNIFNNEPLHTGTGGSGSYKGPWANIYKFSFERQLPSEQRPRTFSWDFRLFLDDWPGLKKYESHTLLSDRFTWTDPETKNSDVIIMG